MDTRLHILDFLSVGFAMQCTLLGIIPYPSWHFMYICICTVCTLHGAWNSSHVTSHVWDSTFPIHTCARTNYTRNMQTHTQIYKTLIEPWFLCCRACNTPAQLFSPYPAQSDYRTDTHAQAFIVKFNLFQSFIHKALLVHIFWRNSFTCSTYFKVLHYHLTIVWLLFKWDS